MPTWQALQNKLNKKIHFKSIEHKDMTPDDMKKVTGFPTIIYINSDGKEVKIRNRNNVENEIS
jgi:hypothetical protein